MKPIEIKTYKCSICGKIYNDYFEAERCCLAGISDMNKIFNHIKTNYINKELTSTDNYYKYVLSKLTLERLEALEMKFKDCCYKNSDFCSFRNKIINSIIILKYRILEECEEAIKEKCKLLEIDGKKYKICWETIIESINNRTIDEEYDIEFLEQLG
ncbi:MAG: hypothetical protein SOV85_01835 [Clostridium sp.]|uniref:hypothetical protein n=1 Tax=Clostridium sp. TaxID=1506 RepID=UPI002A760C03|nr:hypothetical protein [Clostridium sp.]MDY2630084.1 hypothetical protein [Clostridium sp.]